MRDPRPVSAADGVRKRDRDLEQTRQREAVFRKKLGQVSTLDELHRDEVHAVGLLHGVQRHDVGMVQRGDGPGFPLEACPTVRIRRHRLGQYLQRNVAMELGVLGLPDNSHPALADHFDQAVVE